MKTILNFIINQIAYDSRELAEFEGKKGYWRRDKKGHNIFFPEGVNAKQAVKEYFARLAKYNKVQKKYFEPSKEDVEKYKKDLSNKINLKTSQLLMLGKMPLYKILGFSDKPFGLPVNVIDKATKNKHFVKDETIENLQFLIANPVMVMKSITQYNSLVAILSDTDKNNNQIIAILKDTNNKINVIPSVYGKDNFNNFIKNNIEEKNIIYFDDKKISKYIRPQELQLLKEDIFRDNGIIQQKTEIVKNLFMEKEQVSEDETNEEIANYVCDSLDLYPEQRYNKQQYLKGYFIAIDRMQQPQEDKEFIKFLQGA